MDFFEELKWRGLVYQCTDEEGLKKKLEGPLTVYCGYDPTADSLQVGNLLSITMLRRFQDKGYKVVALVGGATGLVGDPGGKSGERALQPAEKVKEWSSRFQAQLGRFLDFSGPATLVDNYDWTRDLAVIPFLRDIGKHFPITQMLAKESVKARLEGGISFTEFSYMLLQANDFLQLHNQYHCDLQVGGSDQWGNITAGCELIRRLQGQEVFGLTTELVVGSDGKKLGKTESGTVWLDPKRTSPYQFYQFWLNVADADAAKFLRLFTFLSREGIEGVVREAKERPEGRAAQKRLATEMTTFVHGPDALKRAMAVTEAFFSGGLETLTREALEEGLQEVPSLSLARAPQPLVEVLVQSGLSSSKRQAREDLTARSVHLIGEGVVQDPAYVLDPGSKATSLHGTYSILRKGKKNYRLIRWQ
jgi:tyrosyl-tRNA synthetase